MQQLHGFEEWLNHHDSEVHCEDENLPHHFTIFRLFRLASALKVAKIVIFGRSDGGEDGLANFF
jgi:hypothetical protein